MDGYVRVSRRMGREGPGYISIPVQKEAIQRWADYRGVEIIAWHVDEDESGGTQDRPGLKEALARVESGETDGIACWRLNRFARNVGGATIDIERIQAAGGSIAFVEEDIDPTGPFGSFILTVLLAVAKLERDNAVAGFEEAKRRAVERGAYISRTPFGYQRLPDGTIEPGPMAPHVTEAFRLAASDNLGSAMSYLKEHVPERNWNTTKVRRLLKGRSYLGETRNGDLVKADTHEPLVSRAIWEAAQDTPNRRRTAEDFPLSGLARCATCNGPMIGSRGGKGQRTYRCSKRCEKAAVVTASILEDHARTTAQEMLQGLEVRIGSEGTGSEDADVLTLLEREISDAEMELDLFATDLTLRKTLKGDYHKYLDVRVQAVDKARSAYREQAKKSETQTVLDTADLTSDDPVLLSAVLRGLFDAILISPGRGLKIGARARFVFPDESDGATGIPRAQSA
jgi:site-specific DNA recombinase